MRRIRKRDVGLEGLNLYYFKISLAASSLVPKASPCSFFSLAALEKKLRGEALGTRLGCMHIIWELDGCVWFPTKWKLCAC